MPKYEKLVCNLYDKQSYKVRIRNLQQALNYGLKLIHKVQKVTKGS